MRHTLPQEPRISEVVSIFDSLARKQKGLILSCAFWQTKIIVNLAAATTKTMLHLAFPMGEKRYPFQSCLRITLSDKVLMLLFLLKLSCDLHP